MNTNDEKVIKRYLENGGNDIYCDLVVPKKITIDTMYESKSIIAFRHSKPLYEYHFVVVPVEHIFDLSDPKCEKVSGEIFRVIRQLMQQMDFQKTGAKIEINNGPFQTSKHLHFHVYGGKIHTNLV